MGAAAVPIAVALIGAGASYAISEATKPDMPDVPDAGADPGKPLDAEEAALRRMRRIRRGRDSLRIEPPATGGTGLQIPA